MTLIATPGATDANAYCTVARAKILLSERLDLAAWVSAPLQEQEQSLTWATRLIDDNAGWTVTSTADTQALWWPVDDAYDAHGNAIASTVIPLFLERATAVYAGKLWDAWVNRRDERLTRFDSGQTLMEWVPGGPSPQDRMPSEVQRAIAPYGRGSAGSMIPIVRV